MDEIQREVLQALLSRGQRVHPRDQWVTEITGLTLELENPRARLIYSPNRKFSLPFAVGELCWYLSGSNRLDIIKHYSQRYAQFSDDNETLHGAYGYRLFTDNLTGFVQWDTVIHKLRMDPDTRQAILHLHMPQDLTQQTRDVPCTCYLQFLIRQGRLDLIVCMRSNDIIWGTPYDVFSFTMLQEIMARQLNLEVGIYKHFAGSMHIYDRHLSMADRILSERHCPKHVMPPMPGDPWRNIAQLLAVEHHLRIDGSADIWPQQPYWGDLARILQGYLGEKRQEPHVASVFEGLPVCYRDLLSAARS